MRGDLGPLKVTRAKSLDHVLAVMRAERPKPIAGGTDVFVMLNDGKALGGEALDPQVEGAPSPGRLTATQHRCA